MYSVLYIFAHVHFRHADWFWRKTHGHAILYAWNGLTSRYDDEPWLDRWRRLLMIVGIVSCHLFHLSPLLLFVHDFDNKILYKIEISVNRPGIPWIYFLYSPLTAIVPLFIALFAAFSTVLIAIFHLCALVRILWSEQF